MKMQCLLTNNMIGQEKIKQDMYFQKKLLIKTYFHFVVHYDNR